MINGFIYCIPPQYGTAVPYREVGATPLPTAGSLAGLFSRTPLKGKEEPPPFQTEGSPLVFSFYFSLNE